MVSAATMLRVNAALARTTGYRLTKAVKGPDLDPQMAATIAAVRPWTMTNEDKLFGLITAVRYVVKHEIPGAMVECGVWRGGSMQAVARTLAEMGEDTRELWLYDTFDGMTEPSEKDVRFDGQTAEQRLASHEKIGSAVWAYASIEDVRGGFSQVDYPAELVHFVIGPVESTIPDEAPDRIALLRLDTDWYESTAHELAHLYDRLVPGGVLVLDDYDWWQGARRAVDEWLESQDEPLLLTRVGGGGGRVAVKPFSHAGR
jgi:O-methyltransferase